MRFPVQSILGSLLIGSCPLLAGCGTTKWSDSPRTATEQLLISDAVDRAVSEIDFAVLDGQQVYLDTRFIVTAVDQNYVVSTLRQQMLANGLIIKDKPDEADYVVEVRSGSLGTNRQDLLFGVPATTLPAPGISPSGAAPIPEIALLKRTNQQGVCKIAVFAYDRRSGRPVWQSGNHKIASRSKDVWVLGAGPFQKGTIHDETKFAGERLTVPLSRKQTASEDPAVARSMLFEENYTESQRERAERPLATAEHSESTSSENVSRAAYTPPAPPVHLPPVTTPPPNTNPPTSGPQGHLAPQSVLPANANPAAGTAGAIQTYNWAKEVTARPR